MALFLSSSPTPAFSILNCKLLLWSRAAYLELISCSLFLYFFLLACAVGVGYFFYTIWIAPYFPQKRKPAKRAAAPVKKIDAGTVTSDSEGPVVSTGAQKYNEEWIPSHHIQRPEARRVKSGGRPKSRGKPEATI